MDTNAFLDMCNQCVTTSQPLPILPENILHLMWSVKDQYDFDTFDGPADRIYVLPKTPNQSGRYNPGWAPAP